MYRTHAKRTLTGYPNNAGSGQHNVHICKPDLADEILYKLADIAVCKFLLNRHVDQLYMQIGQFNIHILRVQKYFLDWHIAVFKIQQLIQYIRQD